MVKMIIGIWPWPKNLKNLVCNLTSPCPARPGLASIALFQFLVNARANTLGQQIRLSLFWRRVSILVVALSASFLSIAPKISQPDLTMMAAIADHLNRSSAVNVLSGQPKTSLGQSFCDLGKAEAAIAATLHRPTGYTAVVPSQYAITSEPLVSSFNLMAFWTPHQHSGLGGGVFGEQGKASGCKLLANAFSFARLAFDLAFSPCPQGFGEGVALGA
jgi:hypothetical protein